MTLHRGRWRKLLALGAIVGLALASSCGDDDDDDRADAGSSGDPIKVVTFQTLENPAYSVPQSKTAAEAAVKAINEAGGINGRPLDLQFCDSNFDPNTEAACARQAVDDGAVAVVGSVSLYPNTIPVLERGKVPFIGGLGQTPAELASEISFPLAAGIPGWFQGAVAQGLQRGVSKPAILVSTQVGAAKFAGEGYATALGTAGVPVVRTVEVPVGAPDQAAAAAQAAEGTDAVFISTLEGDAVKLVQALRQSNYSGLIVGASISFGNSLTALGDAGNGMLLTSQVAAITDTGNPAVARFITEMDAIDPDARKDERSQAVWAAYQLVSQVLERMDGDITAATVLEAMRTLSEPVETGMVGPYSVQGRTSPVDDAPRIYNPTVTFTEVQNQQLQQVSDGFVNPFDVLEQVAGR